MSQLIARLGAPMFWRERTDPLLCGDGSAPPSTRLSGDTLVHVDFATLREKFHAHLDGCVQCRSHPMALCATGNALLELVGQCAVRT